MVTSLFIAHNNLDWVRLECCSWCLGPQGLTDRPRTSPLPTILTPCFEGGLPADGRSLMSLIAENVPPPSPLYFEFSDVRMNFSTFCFPIRFSILIWSSSPSIKAQQRARSALMLQKQMTTSVPNVGYGQIISDRKLRLLFFMGYCRSTSNMLASHPCWGTYSRTYTS